MQRSSVLIVVQNLPVPLDRRVWLEAQALRDAGHEVSVICPKGPDDPRFHVLDGISLYKYTAPQATSGLLSYVIEFAYCWLRTALLSLKVYRRHRFTILQACNPPDTYWLLGRFWKLFGVKYVFDQHDLNPELFRSRFGEPVGLGGRAQLGILKWLERRTYRTADHVIVTNESYRQIAVGRGGRHSGDVTVVRSGPNTSAMRPVPGRPELRKGASHLLAYIGIMGPQDNVDVLVETMNVLVNDMKRDDVHLVLMGFGACLEPLQQQVRDLGLTERVTFTGRVGPAEIAQYLSTATIGVSPDLKTPLNDVSTHNKTMEYMAFALPVVSFDLVESRHSSAGSAVYVESGDVTAFAKAIDSLLDDPDRREKMSRLARERCVTHLDWSPQSQAYVAAFDRLAGREVPAPPRPLVPADGNLAAPADTRVIDRRRNASELPVVAGHSVIDLRDPYELTAFLRTRQLPSAQQGDGPSAGAPEFIVQPSVG